MVYLEVKLRVDLSMHQTVYVKIQEKAIIKFEGKGNIVNMLDFPILLVMFNPFTDKSHIEAADLREKGESYSVAPVGQAE